MWRLLVLIFCSALPALAVSDSDAWWSVQTRGLDTNLRGVSVSYDTGSKDKSHYIVWASGSNGVVLRSTNDGASWTQITVPGGSDLDLRDIEAFDADTAYVMSSGDGNKSRIYKTTDGGKNWKLQYSDKRSGFFLDSLACDSKTHCFALSDPVDGKFVVLVTEDGDNWKELPRDRMPAALAKEGAFAASGTSFAICEGGSIFFGTGGGTVARVFRSQDRGVSWKAFDTPIAAGNASSGIFSLACDGSTLVAVGGDYREPASVKNVAAYSTDDGETWHLAEQQPGGYRSAVGSFSYGDFVAVGTNGTDIRHPGQDQSMRWRRADALNLNAVSFSGQQGWGVGPKGMIARFLCHFEYQVLIHSPGALTAPQAKRSLPRSSPLPGN